MPVPTNVIPPATVVAPNDWDSPCCQTRFPVATSNACMLGSWISWSWVTGPATGGVGRGLEAPEIAQSRRTVDAEPVVGGGADEPAGEASEDDVVLPVQVAGGRIQRVVRPILSGHPEEGRRAARVGHEVRGGAKVPVARRVALQEARRGERPPDRPVADVHGEHAFVIRGRAVVVAIGDGDDLQVHALDDGG